MFRGLGGVLPRRVTCRPASITVPKIAGALAAFEEAAPSFGDRVDIGTISVGCGLGYVDFRLGHLYWRARRPKLAAWYEKFVSWPSMDATKPPAA